MNESERGIEVVEMTVDEWISIPDNPVQRETEARAEKAQKNHMKVLVDAHRAVSAAELPDLSLVKLDGHTRAYLWEHGILERPRSVLVTVYPVETIEQAIQYYKHYDSPLAVESARDRQFGACKYHGIELSRLFVHKAGLTTALQEISATRASKIDIVDLVADWRDEIITFSGIDFKDAQLTGWITIAALLTIRRYGAKSLGFWDAYVNSGGVKNGREFDGVYALESLRRDAVGKVKGGPEKISYAEKAISCCEAWIAGRTFTGGVKGTDFEKYVKEMGLRKSNVNIKRPVGSKKNVATRKRRISSDP